MQQIDQNSYTFNRSFALEQLSSTPLWDIAIIGGGATGLGIAVDAATRGYKTLLVEQADFAKGTSSRSTKLVHGGVRYLAQGNIKLVYEALRERGIIFQNAPHLAHAQPFIIPCYSWFSKLKFLAGLKIYDWMAGKYRVGRSSLLSKEQVLQELAGINPQGLTGGIRYYDGQFDDARMAINLAQTANAYGATLLNYIKLTRFSKDGDGKLKGAILADQENGDMYTIQAKAIINATGIFVDDVLTLAEPKHQPLVRPSQGVHLVVDSSFLPGKNALMIPKTSDGRVLFGVPWHHYLVLGTTDTPIHQHSLEPRALDKEIDFILNTAGEYLERKPTKKDIRSVFAGLRPLAAPKDGQENTKEISRNHKLIVSQNGLITITGGKWTTYRKMAEDTIDQAIKTAKLPPQPCKTEHIPIHGTDIPKIQQLIEQNKELGQKLHPDYSYTEAQVIWAVRHEMARTVEDILARRMRILFLDARAAIEMAPRVAQLLGKELQRDSNWVDQQTATFRILASGYFINNP